VVLVWVTRTIVQVERVPVQGAPPKMREYARTDPSRPLPREWTATDTCRSDRMSATTGDRGGDMDNARIGFVGLGRMGEPMAGRLVDSGVPLTVWNRSPPPSSTCSPPAGPPGRPRPPTSSCAATP
jgi:lactate dehydrogenase-like 2-hydroxyacid dehydrogenase